MTVDATGTLDDPALYLGNLDTEAETTRSSRFEEAVLQALRYISKHYEVSADPRTHLEYHNTEHTQDVIDRIQKLLEILSPDDVPIGRVAAAWHDAVQHWTTSFKMEGDYQVVGKKRMIEFNEHASAHMAVTYMRYINDTEGPTFTEEDMTILTEAIFATIPDYDQELQTVRQPHFTRNIHIVGKALALADLGGAAMNGGVYFIEEGNRNFREMNGDITDLVHRDEVEFVLFSPGYRESLRTRILAHTAGQVHFAQGRLTLLPGELALLPEEHREAVAALMDKLPEAIAAAQATLERRSEMSLEELIADVYGSR